MSVLSIVSVQPISSTDDLGIEIGEAIYTDGVKVSLRVLSLAPLRVHLYSARPIPRHLQALERWLAEQYEPVAV